MQTIGDLMGLVPVPESTFFSVGEEGVTFPFRPSTHRPVLDPTDPDASTYLRNETHYWGASDARNMAPENAKFAGPTAKRILLSSPRTSDPEHGDIVHDPNLGAPEDMEQLGTCSVGSEVRRPSPQPSVSTSRWRPLCFRIFH